MGNFYGSCVNSEGGIVMKVQVIDFLDNYAICKFKDEDGYDAYGYLHSSEVDDMFGMIEEKLNIGQEIYAELMYESKGDKILTVKSANGKTFEDRLEGLEKFDPVICEVVKETKRGSIVNIKGIPGYLSGNLEKGTKILASVSKILMDKNMILLNLESVF